MKKREIITKAQVEQIVFNAFGLKVIAEDNSYELKPLEWYTKSPWYGRQRYPRVGDSVDCDDMNTVLKYEWFRRHWKRAGKGTEHGSGGYSSLPVFQVKMEMHGTRVPHWAMIVVAKEGVVILERGEATVHRAESHKRLIVAHI